jgi:hypothetical protein
MFRRMKRHRTEWQRLLAEYALARVVYQLAREAVDRRSHNKNTMTAALLVEVQAREKLVEVRRRMCRIRPLHKGPPLSAAPGARELST